MKSMRDSPALVGCCLWSICHQLWYQFPSSRRVTSNQVRVAGWKYGWGLGKLSGRGL